MRARLSGWWGARLLTALSIVSLSGDVWAASGPDLFSFGLGDFAFNTPQHRALDLRLDYRPGYSLLPGAEPSVQVHPWLGIEATSNGMLYGAAGLLADIPLGPLILTPSVGAGAWHRGGSKDLGSVLEFRSTLELGYRFENSMRLSAYISHMSNAGISHTNPGANNVGAYLHVPVSVVFGR